jgi:hypothetical protein
VAIPTHSALALIIQQGNAYVLSRDLAEEVAAVCERPWIKLIADDVLVGMLVAKLNPRFLDWKADMVFNSDNTQCTDGADHHFNVPPKAMFALYDNHKRKVPQCNGIESLSPLRLSSSDAFL